MSGASQVYGRPVFGATSDELAAAQSRTAHAKLRAANVKRILLGPALLSLPTAANACSVCMGDANSNVAGAANGAIFLMLGAIGSMLAALSAFGFYLYKRANTPIPPHVQLVEEMRLEGAAQSHA